MVNRSLSIFLCSIHVDDQKDWVIALTQAGFAYNNVVNSSTSLSPFMI